MLEARKDTGHADVATGRGVLSLRSFSELGASAFIFRIFIVSRTYFHIFIKIVRVLLTITHHLVKLRWLK